VNALSTAPLVYLAAIALLFSAGCGRKRIATPATARVQVVLLPDPDSDAPSAATVNTQSGGVVLTTPFESTSVVANSSPTAPTKMAEAEVQRQFGAVLANLPPPTQHFNLYFKTDSAELTDESRAVLPEVIRAVAGRAVPEVTVIGHTDTTGSKNNNHKLGLERAETVRALLLKVGLDATLIEIGSHGEADLLHKTPDNTAEPRNRRVEITIR
jgi:outer membrane protein OmpA-like peptidoglycan-associated protein